MAKDQFIIPGSQNETSPLNEALRIADAAQYSPETQPAAFGFIKNIEDKIDSYRETALELGIVKKKMWVRAIEPFVVNTKSPHDQLIEKESRIGGTLYPSIPDARFWLNKRHEEDPAGVRNWLFSYTNPQTKQLEAIVYQTKPGGEAIEKVYAGLPRPLTDEEAKNFVDAVQMYKQRVRHELYLLDDVIEELSDAA